MKKLILIFIIGLLVGAIIATSGFYIYFKLSNNNSTTFSMQGQPPEMPGGNNSNQPPEKPSGDDSNQPPEKPDGDNSNQQAQTPNNNNSQPAEQNSTTK